MKKQTKSKVELTPPDHSRCQAEEPNGYTFMSFGGVAGFVRCRARPIVIVQESVVGKDGLRGRMSLCADCLRTLVKQNGTHTFTVTALVLRDGDIFLS